MAKITETHQVMNKVEELAEKRRDLVQYNLNVNILGYYGGKWNQELISKCTSLQKEIELLELELSPSDN